MGLVALAGADATIALGAVTGLARSAAAVLPAGWASSCPRERSAADVNARRLLGLSFALVVAGAAGDRGGPAQQLRLRRGPSAGATAAWDVPGRADVVAVLVYAALSGTPGRAPPRLGAVLASALFLTVSTAFPPAPGARSRLIPRGCWRSGSLAAPALPGASRDRDARLRRRGRARDAGVRRRRRHGPGYLRQVLMLVAGSAAATRTALGRPVSHGASGPRDPAPVPASGTRAIAAALIVSATRSSGSRLCTCDFPHRARERLRLPASRRAGSWRGAGRPRPGPAARPGPGPWVEIPAGSRPSVPSQS